MTDKVVKVWKEQNNSINFSDESSNLNLHTILSQHHMTLMNKDQNIMKQLHNFIYCTMFIFHKVLKTYFKKIF